MSYSIYICSRNVVTGVVSGIEFSKNVPVAFSFIDKLDDSLDIGQITFRGTTTSSQPYDLFDWVEIYELEPGTLYDDLTIDPIYSMRIYGDNVTMISKNPVKYQHELTLVEHTKILERFIISGKTFRQPVDKSLPPRYYIYDVLEDLRDTTPLEMLSIHSDYRLFTLPTSGDNYDLWTTTKSPEFTFKDVTLREAINKVLSSVDAVGRLVLNSSGELELTADYQNEIKDIIASESDFFGKFVQQDGEFYATSIESEVLNAVGDTYDSESVEIYPSPTSFVTPRTSGVEFDFLQSFIPTPKRIYDVLKIVYKFKGLFETSPPSSEGYNSNYRYDMYATFSAFPVVGNEEFYYVDISDNYATYTWNQSAFEYQSESLRSFIGTSPKVQFYATASSFIDPIDPEYTGWYVARDTGIGYWYNDSTSTYDVVDFLDSDGLILVDITDRIIEKKIYDTLKFDDTDRLDTTKFYRSNTIYYEYRQKNINVGETTGIFDTETNLTYALINSIAEKFSGTDWGGPFSNFEYFGEEENLLFQVHYKPIPQSTRLNLDRADTNDVKYNSSLLSNQQSRIVELGNFADNLYGRINRVGNSELRLEHRVSSFEDLYEVGDYTSDFYVITERETIFYKDFILGKYSLTRNFNQLSKFIGVNSENRQYSVDEINAVERNLMYKEYVVIDAVSTGTGSDTSLMFEDDGIQTFLETFKPSSLLEPIRTGVLKSSEVPDYILIPFSSVGGGNSLNFSFLLESNKHAGNYRTSTVYGALPEPKIINDFANYTDSTGEMEQATFYFIDSIEQQRDLVLFDANILPILDSGTWEDNVNKVLMQTEPLVVKKDSAEIINGTFQIQMVPAEYGRVIIGRNLSSRNRLISENPPSSIKLYHSTTNFLPRTMNRKLDTSLYTELTSPSITISTTLNRITVSHTSLTSSSKSWVLTDEDDNVLIGVNQDGSLTNYLTFDFLNKRTDIRYKY